MAATTAVVAGTAGAVSHHQQQKYAAKDQQAYEAQQYEQQQAMAQQPQVVYAEPPAAEAPADDPAAQIGRLADLKAQGVLSDEEFEAAKAKLISG